MLLSEPTLTILPDRDYERRLRQDVDLRRVWYARHLGLLPRAYYHRASHEVVVCASARQNLRLLAHEYGHAQGLRHPAPSSLAYWTDIMGYGLRVVDRHGLRAPAQAWLASQGGG